jgi:hypothetical protein
VSEEKVHNLMRGIAAYANPERELARRNFVVSYLTKTLQKDRVEALDGLVKRFGRETVRAVVGPEGA